MKNWFVLFLLIIVMCLSVVGCGNDRIEAPASDSEELVAELEKIAIKSVSEDEIILADSVSLKENDKVALWIYSEPQFLGYFTVKLETGLKKISGLSEALENIEIEPGNHHLAISTSSGNKVGYIEVYVHEEGKLANIDENGNITITKKVTNMQIIEFEIEEQEDTNRIKGYMEVIKKGINGLKEVTYNITYDLDGNELSKQKLSEEVIEKPVNQEIIVGVSNFNTNEDMLTEISFGPACTVDKTYEDKFGNRICDEETYPNLPQYTALKINNTYYITSITENGKIVFSGLLKVTGTERVSLIADYNGQKHYFYMSGGGGKYELLTKETCDKYGLKCGAW